MAIYSLTLYKSSSDIEPETKYQNADSPIQAVKAHWVFAQLHSVNHNIGRTVWRTQEGLVSCELAKLPGEGDNEAR